MSSEEQVVSVNIDTDDDGNVRFDSTALSSRDTEIREVLEGLLPFVQKVAALTCSRTMGAEGDVCGFYERDVKDFCAACHAETLLTDDGLQLRTALNQPPEKSLPGE